MRIIFMGNDEFSLPFAKFCIENHQSLIVTSKDSLVHHYCKLKEFADNISINQLIVTNINDEYDKLKEFNSDMIIVASFGSILSSRILSLPAITCLNIHPSLLPKYRGPSPISTALINNDRVTGVSLMKMNDKMDEGDIYARVCVPIEANDNYFSLLKRCSLFGLELLKENIYDIVNPIESNRIKPIEQSQFISSLRTYTGPLIYEPLNYQSEFEEMINKTNDNDLIKSFYTHKITKNTLKINWNWPVRKIIGLINCYKEKAWTSYKGKKLFITSAEPLTININEYYKANKLPGEAFIVEDRNEKYLSIVCGDYLLRVYRIQREGKKEMDIKSFLNGARFFSSFSFD